MRVVVTGANGFVGTALCDTLSAGGDEVFAVVRPRCVPGRIRPTVAATRVLALDLEDGLALDAALRAVEPDACVHLAWYVAPERYKQARENVASMKTSVDLFAR